MKLKKFLIERAKNITTNITISEQAINKEYRKNYIYWLRIAAEFVLLIYLLSILYFILKNTFNSDIFLSLTQSLILFETAIAIFWYTRETFDLKAIQQKQLKLERKLGNISVMPYLQLHAKLTQENVLEISNSGQGLAKNIRLTFYYNDTENEVKTVPVIAPGDTFQFESIYFGDLFDDLGSIIIDEGSSIIAVKGSYEDYLDRKYLLELESSVNNADVFKVLKQEPENWSINKEI